MSEISSALQIDIKDVWKSFPLKTPVRGHKFFPVLRGLKLKLAKGRATALVGESGCGKTTLAKILMQMEPHDQGEIRIGNQLLGELKESECRSIFQMVFQDPHASLNPRWSLESILREPLLPMGLSSEQIKSRIAEILKAVGFDESVLGRRVSSFSGGQKQRLVIARALLMNPEILICDEPVSALDVSIQGQILNLLFKLKKERNLGLLFISHDLSVVRAFADDVAILYLGRVVEQGPAEQVLSQPKHPYTKLLLDSIPRIDGSWDPFSLAESGETPSPLEIQTGCSFASRCKKVTDQCRQKAPEWTARRPAEQDAEEKGGFECYHPN